MTDERRPSPQPELYRCDCCENYSITSYGLNLQVDFVDPDAKEENGWREWTYRLCRHCYYRWFEGKMSTRELITLGNHNSKQKALVE